MICTCHKPHKTSLQGAVTAAMRHGCTHVAFSDPGKNLPEPVLNLLADAARRQPSAVVIGCRAEAGGEGSFMGRTGRLLDRLLVQLQTGRRLSDPASPLRVYPLNVLQHLASKAKGGNIERALLVKSIWAGVDIEEVPVGLTADNGKTASARRGTLLASTQSILLNIHWTLRAMIPWPHQPLDTGSGKASRKVSVFRPIQSIRALLSENATPGRLAWAGAMGVLNGTLPILGFHTVTILLTANFFRLNKVAAIATATLCAPPFVPALCIELGYYLRHGKWLTEISLQTLGYQAVERLYEWLLGSLILGPLLAAVIGGAIYLIAAPMARQMALASEAGPAATPSAGRSVEMTGPKGDE